MNYGFSYPAALALLPLGIGVLVFVYRKRGVGKRLVAPTTFLLKQLQNISRARRVFTPPARFFFEVLVLAILTAAIAGLYKAAPAQQVVLLIDNSFSMNQASAAQTIGGSAFSSAIARGREVLAGLGSNDSVEVFASSPRLRAVTTAAVSASEALSTLSEIEPTYAQDRLELAIPQLLGRSGVDRLVVVSDRTLELGGAQASTALDFLSIRPNVAGQPNVAISNISFVADGNTLRISIYAFAPELVPVKVELYGVVDDMLQAYSRVQEKSVVVPKMGQVEVEFSALPKGFESFFARAVVERSVISPHADAISADNEAWISRALGKQKILLVSDIDAHALGLDRLAAVQIDSRAPSSSGQLVTEADWRTYSGAIFHHYAPPALPPINSLFVVPPEEGLFPSRALSGDSPVTSWDDTHPILSYLNMPTLTFTNTRVFSLPVWAHELMRAREGVVAFAGERSGFRYAALGFEVLPFEGGKAPFLSILFLNTLKYISDSPLAAGFAGVGSAVPGLEAVREFDFLGTSGVVTHKTTLGKAETIGSLPGLYRAGSGSWVAVNFFNPEESDTFNARPISLALGEHATERESSRISLSSSLALVALLVLLADLLILLLRRMFRDAEQA
ncbi:MAG: VWA domain-containing protein [Oligoflexia bacterium]|nr:VWA domain-containing protein [Oligoflexia bacterium]